MTATYPHLLAPLDLGFVLHLRVRQVRGDPDYLTTTRIAQDPFSA